MSRIRSQKLGQDLSLVFTQQNNVEGIMTFDGTNFEFDKPLSVDTIYPTNGVIKTVADATTLKLNSRDYTATSGDIIGFQSRPNATAAGTTTVYGGQISPRFANGITGEALVGLSVEPIMKGATAAAISGDYRVLDLKLSADSTAAGHTVGGFTSCLNFYNNLKTGTYTGGVFPIVLNNNGDTQAWTGFMSIVGALGTNTCTTASDKTAQAKSGTLKVYVGATLYHIQLYANA